MTHALSRLQPGGSSATAPQTYWGTVPWLKVAVAGQTECVPGRQGRVHGHMFPLGAPAALLESILHVLVVRILRHPARLHLRSTDVSLGSPLYQTSPSDSAGASKEDHCQHHLAYAIDANRQMTHHYCYEQTPGTGLLEMGKQYDQAPCACCITQETGRQSPMQACLA